MRGNARIESNEDMWSLQRSESFYAATTFCVALVGILLFNSFEESFFF